MTSVYDVAEAKAHLSRLLDAAVAGEEVIVARAGQPLVRLVPVQPPAGRKLGFAPMSLPDGLFDPLEEAGPRESVRMSASAARREAARAKREFPVGTRIRVQLGARKHEAVVVEHRNGRVWVNIHIAGGDEPMLSSYAPDQLEHAS